MKTTNLCEELEDVFKMMEKAGLNPQLCDTPVPFIDAGVQAGIPVEPGDYTRGECIMLPQSLVRGNMTFTIQVRGLSMKDANILPGDQVQIVTGVMPQDGDIIIASIDGECTLKSYCMDENGKQWLVPHNTDFKPIMLTPEMNLRVVGKVTCVMRDTPRVPHAEQIMILRQSRIKMMEDEKQPPTHEQIAEAIRAVAGEVKQRRQWFAVFRAMVDAGVYDAEEYRPFIGRVTETVPQHEHLPVTTELRRMAVQSFSKEVARWKENDAPVRGIRFAAYVRIAKLTTGKLQG